MAAAAAAAAAAGAPASPRTANNGRGGVVQVYHRVTSGGSSQFGLDRAQREYSRIVAEAAAATPNTAASAVAANADYNHHQLGWAQHAFLRADQEYAGVRRVCGTVEGRWEEANRRLQDAARAVAAPRADLIETYRQYTHAENCFRTGEALVNAAEGQEARAKRELERATEALEVAGRAVVRAEVTLCDFDRSYFSPEGGRVESRAPAGPDVQIKPGDGLARQEEGRDMKQERARGSRSHASVPPLQDFVLPAAVGTKSWTAVHGAQPAHAGGQGGGAGPMDVDGEDFKQLAQALLEDSQRGEDEPLQNCDAGAAAKARMPMSVGTACEHKCEEPSRGGEGGGAVPAARESETKLDKTKYLGRLADTLQNARQIWREATAQKNRAHIEVDQAVLLVGARTLGDLSFAAKRRSSAAKLYQKARAEAAPVLKALMEHAKAFQHADTVRAIARGNLNLAWEARELARVRPQPTTAALFAAAAAVAAASAEESIPPPPFHDHGAARRMNTFHAGEVARTAVGGAQHSVSATRSTEQASWRGGAPGQVLRSPRGG